MLVIGLTGGIGSGKTTVANLFAQKGITVIDADEVAREVTQPNQAAFQHIIKKWGPEILLEDGTLNRSALRQKIFEHADDRIWLEKLLHPLIRAEMKRRVEASQSPYCIVVIPLLFETEPNPIINKVLVVDAAEEHQVQRTQIRDKSSAERIAAIVKTQVNREKRLAGADYIIHNEGPIEDLIPQVDQLHQQFLILSA